ncbi:hypothetical protein KM043_017152 [Ampulex compressa]|nr:hypothetical protein KM043_017152 [Ampulex compressa]
MVCIQRQCALLIRSCDRGCDSVCVATTSIGWIDATQGVIWVSKEHRMFSGYFFELPEISSIGYLSHICGLGRFFAYKSAFSLENLYPKSNLKLYTPNFEPEEPNAKFNGFIPMDQLNVTYSRSSGPGGQHVNCVNTKVDLRFNVKDANWLSEEIKEKVIEKNQNRINKAGELIIKSEITRSQQLNLADALERLRTLIRESIVEPKEPSPESEERKRKNLLKAARERVFLKRRRSEIKQSRQGTFELP